ncbi:MAG: undecaprenyldiphospho-muramoylpentapeptide beta-N-acetylglucosaminyltransferase [Sphingomonadaceae bacterium]
MSGPVVIAAGGTGGHMVPAHVFAGELVRRGRRVALFSDARGLRLPGLFEGIERHELASGSPARGGAAATAFAVGRGALKARRLLRRLGAAAVVGFGGYPSLPGLIAALWSGLPTMIHEQNAVLGRVNRLLQKRVDRVATAYARVERLEAPAGKVRLTGNPVRPEIAAVAPPNPAVERNILVMGGSQGAAVFATVVPRAIVRLAGDGRPLQVTQQARPEDIPAVREIYAKAGIPADIAPYFLDVPGLLGRAELVIARAGASTIAELTASGRPAILVPLPTAMDDHQSANARALAEAGGAILIPQPQFTPERLAEELARLTTERLATMAAAARALGRPDAAAALADVLEEIAPA